MPEYKNSKLQKRSQTQSKSSGRRRKNTMRKFRRGKKSRKVMRGGGFMSLKSANDLRNLFKSNQPLLLKLEEAIKNDARNNGSIDKFFDNVKGTYNSLGTKTIAEQHELNSNEYAELRAFLKNPEQKN